MNQAPLPTQRPVGRYVAVALLFALPAAYGAVSVVSDAWNACDVGINASANQTGLVLFHLPVVAGAHAALLALAYVLARRWVTSLRARIGLLMLVTIAILAAVTWTYFALAGLPLQNALCPDGEPVWWPLWLPPAHDVQP